MGLAGMLDYLIKSDILYYVSLHDVFWFVLFYSVKCVILLSEIGLMMQPFASVYKLMNIFLRIKSIESK